jgi:hypothetical protein
MKATKDNYINTEIELSTIEGQTFKDLAWFDVDHHEIIANSRTAKEAAKKIQKAIEASPRYVA